MREACAYSTGSAATAAKLGKVLGAEVVVQGSFEKQGKLLRVVTRMTSLQDGEVLDSMSEVVPYVTPSDKLRAAEIVADKLRALVASTPVAYAGHQLGVTISGGVATHDPETTISETLREADRALYAAKLAGRNRLVAAESL